MSDTLINDIRSYNKLLELKNEQEEGLKQTKKLVEEQEKAICDYMAENETSQITVDGYSYSLTNKTRYSKKADDKLEAEGLDFFEFLREEGLGDIIKETVNAQTLSAQIRQIVEDNDDELPDEYDKYINAYDQVGLTRRKSAKK